jgi:hypothetical protein
MDQNFGYLQDYTFDGEANKIRAIDMIRDHLKGYKLFMELDRKYITYMTMMTKNNINKITSDYVKTKLHISKRDSHTVEELLDRLRLMKRSALQIIGKLALKHFCNIDEELFSTERGVSYISLLNVLYEDKDHEIIQQFFKYDDIMKNLNKHINQDKEINELAI